VNHEEIVFIAKVVAGVLVFAAFVGYRVLQYGIKLGYKLSQHQDTAELLAHAKQLKDELVAPEYIGVELLIARIMKLDVPKPKSDDDKPSERKIGF